MSKEIDWGGPTKNLDKVSIWPEGFSWWDESDKQYEMVSPPTLREVGLDRVNGRTILSFSDGLGSYGMGGPGFCGFQLAATDEFPEEWLVLCLWGATNWLTYNGEQLWDWCRGEEKEGHPMYGKEFISVAKFKKELKNFTIANLQVERETFTMHLANDCLIEAIIELPVDQKPLQGRRACPNQWHPNEHMLDAFVVSPSRYLLI